MNKVLIFSFDKNFKKYEKALKNQALSIIKSLRQTGVMVEIYLLNTDRMRSLNKKYRGKNKDTSVLSFGEIEDFPHPESQYRCLGEIYLNPSYIKKERQIFLEKQNFDIKKTLVYLLIHGLLHLFGYNHAKKGDRIKMTKKERFLYSRISG